MREILRELDRWLEQGEEIALATLVQTHGASPRPPGARLALTRSGSMIGSVSNGCVESDVFERALRVLDEGRPVLQSYGIDDELGPAVGLSCGGSIDVLIEPFRPGEAWAGLRAALAAQRPAALCLGVSPDALVGRSMAVLGHPAVAGSLDAELDATVGTEASRLLRAGGHRTLALPWRGAHATVFIEAFPPQPRLFIAGATHTAIPLCRMARELGFHVSVIDPRSAFTRAERFAQADALLREWPHEVLDRAELDSNCYVLTLTHDLKFDIPALARALRSEVRYIGALGSRRTHERRKAKLREEGFSDRELARIHTPIGLDIGARTPEEVALAILSEIVAVRHGREGRPLVERQAPIHADGDREK